MIIKLIMWIIGPGKDIKVERFRLFHSGRYRIRLIKNLIRNRESYDHDICYNHLINYFMEKSEIKFTLFSISLLALLFLIFGTLVAMSLATFIGVLLCIQFALASAIVYGVTKHLLEAFYLSWFNVEWHISVYKNISLKFKVD